MEEEAAWKELQALADADVELARAGTPSAGSVPNPLHSMEETGEKAAVSEVVVDSIEVIEGGSVVDPKSPATPATPVTHPTNDSVLQLLRIVKLKMILSFATVHFCLKFQSNNP